MSSETQTTVRLSRPNTFLLNAHRREILHRWVNAQLRFKADPEKRSLLMVKKVLEQQNANNCPLCGDALELADYHETKTLFWRCAKIRCSACRNDWILEESHVA